MGAKNDFLTRMQNQAATNELMSVAEAIAHTKQAMSDAMILALGYGECMGNDKWGEQRIMAFKKEVEEAYKNDVFPGIEVRNDSDGFRDKVDKLLKKKCPNCFVPWRERYVFWREETLEEQAAREKKQQNRKKKRR